MSSLAELEELKKKQEELEKKIQEEQEQKRLEKIGQLSNLKKCIDNHNKYIETSGHRTQYTDVCTKRLIVFLTIEQFETLYEILKKQDERIKDLERKLA
mgnify:CR=1 FL=1